MDSGGGGEREPGLGEAVEEAALGLFLLEPLGVLIVTEGEDYFHLSRGGAVGSSGDS